MTDPVALKPGTILADDYRIERTLGAGGFGITYLAEEISLARLVTIKEYFPVDFAARDHLDDVVPRSEASEGDYSWGLDRFLAEAQTLARFTHPNIVRVYRYFLARNTGYIVLHYEEGQSLKSWLRSLGRAPRQPELDRLLEPLLSALETVHAADYLHRDIAPDNIMIRRDGAPVLIDFGSARGDIAKHSKTISALVKPGYSPYEQYATNSRQQGPWTDIYSLGATLYEAVTGKRPPDAPSRMVADDLIPAADAALSSYRPGFLAAIAKSLRLEIGERPRSVAVWRAELMAPPARAAAPAGPSPAAAREARPEAPAPTAAEAANVSPPGSAPAAAAAMPVPPPAPPGPGSLAAAFLDGWRKAKPPASGAVPPAAAPAAPAAAEAAPKPAAAEAQAAPPPAPKAERRLLPVRARAEPPPPEPGARKATPRALRRRGGGRWRPLAFKLLLGFIVAGAAVALQDHIPTVRREGASLLTSQPGVDIPVALIKGHRGAVAGLAFTGDGQQIVSAAVDGTLKVWNAQRGSLSRTIELDAGAATAFALGRGRAATGHRDGTVALWDLDAGVKLASFRRGEGAITALAFGARPDQVVAGAEDGSIAVWETSRPATPLHLFEEHEGAVRALAFTERATALASGGADARVKLWSLARGEFVRTYRGHGDAALAVAFDADGRTLASGAQDGGIRLWSALSNRLKRKLSTEGPVAALAFAGSDHLLAAGGDGVLRLWDTRTGRVVRTLQSGAGHIAALAVSGDGRRAAVAGSDGSIRIWDTSPPKAGS